MNTAPVFVEERREVFEDGLDKFFGHGGDDHDKHPAFIEHQRAFVAAVAAFTGQTFDDGVAAEAAGMRVLTAGRGNERLDKMTRLRM